MIVRYVTNWSVPYDCKFQVLEHNKILRGAQCKGRLLALPTNIRLSWKWLAGTITRAYLASASGAKKKKLYNTDTWQVFVAWRVFLKGERFSRKVFETFGPVDVGRGLEGAGVGRKTWPPSITQPRLILKVVIGRCDGRRGRVAATATSSSPALPGRPSARARPAAAVSAVRLSTLGSAVGVRLVVWSRPSCSWSTVL